MKTAYVNDIQQYIPIVSFILSLQTNFTGLIPLKQPLTANRTSIKYLAIFGFTLATLESVFFAVIFAEERKQGTIITRIIK